MSDKTRPEEEGPFLFVGNMLCLDFVNTEVMSGGRAVDLIGGFDGLVAWLERAGALDGADAAGALERWGKGREGTRAVEAAREFRAALREIAGRLADGRRVEQALVDAVNERLGAPTAYSRVARTRDGYEERRLRRFERAADLLAPVAESAVALLCDADHSLVKRCGNPSCILYFSDTTKNHARTWCSMSGCGNRMKVAAHYRRKRGE